MGKKKENCGEALSRKEEHPNRRTPSNTWQGITRRDLLSAGLVSAAGGLLLPGLSFKAHGQTPKKGGHLRQGVDGASVSDTLNPAYPGQPFISNLCFQLRNHLTEIGLDGDLIPGLAESWEPAGTAASWIFNLRSGVEFHNGKTLTVEDVIYSINYHRREGTKSPASVLLKPIKEIKKLSDFQFRVDLEKPNSDFPYLVSRADQNMQIVPANTTDFRDGMGTGAFILHAFEPGVRALTKRNPNFWRPDRGHVDSVETIAISDPTSRANALLSGEVDFVNNLDPTIVGRLSDKQTVQMFRTPGWLFFHFTCRIDNKPFESNDVRLALKYGINREEILSKSLYGFGRVGNDNPIADTLKFHVSLPQREYDPERAKYHLKKAGVERLTVPLHVSDGAFPRAVQSAELYQQQIAKAGVNIDIKREPKDGYWSEVWLKKPFYAGWWRGRPTADNMLSIAYHSGAPWNEGQFKRDHFDQLLEKGRAEIDEKKRAEIYAECQRILWEEGPSVIFAFGDYLDGGSSKLRGFEPTPSGGQSGYSAPEKLWFA